MNPLVGEAIRLKYPNAVFGRDYVLSDSSDGNGPQFVVWNLSGDPPTDADLEGFYVQAAQQRKQKEMRRHTARSILAGTSSNVLGADYLYPTDTETQNNVHGLITKASIYPDEGPFPVWCAPVADPDDWKRRGHTDEQIKSLGKVYVAHVSARQDQYASLLDQAAAIVADFEAGDTTADDAIAAIDAIEWTEPGA